MKVPTACFKSHHARKLMFRHLCCEKTPKKSTRDPITSIYRPKVSIHLRKNKPVTKCQRPGRFRNLLNSLCSPQWLLPGSSNNNKRQKSRVLPRRARMQDREANFGRHLRRKKAIMNMATVLLRLRVHRRRLAQSHAKSESWRRIKLMISTLAVKVAQSHSKDKLHLICKVWMDIWSAEKNQLLEL